MTIAVLGGTGPEGSGLALRLGLAGFPVLIGSRSCERARETAEELRHRLGRGIDSTVFTGKENTEAARVADLIFLTAPFEHAADLLRVCLPVFQTGSTLVDVTVPLAFQAGQVQVMELRGRLGKRASGKIFAGGNDAGCGVQNDPGAVAGGFGQGSGL